MLAMIAFTYSFGQKKETLKILWPEEYKWKVGSNQEDESVHMLELIPGNETVEKWTIIGTMTAIKGVKDLPMDKAMALMYDQAKLGSAEAKLTLIEKDVTSKHPWIIFKIEAPHFTNDPTPESQLYYMIQGDVSLYSNFVAIKQASLDDAFVKKWTAIFKASEFVAQ